MRWAGGLVTALAWVATATSSAADNSSTPAPYPLAPPPGECVVAPLEVDAVLASLATLAAGAAEAGTPFTAPDGEPADAQTAVEVEATLRQVFACANAGDPRRVAALFTDEFQRAFFGDAPPEQVRAFLSAPPQPLPDDQQRIIRAVGAVQLLDDGRAGVLIILDEPDDPRAEEPDYVILKQAGGAWLVDEIHEDPMRAGTPAAAASAP